MGYRTKVDHADLTLFFGGAKFHDRWLNQRNQGHVRVSGNCDSTQEVWSQFSCQVNSGRAISAADDADGSCFLDIEAEEHSACKGYEYADLSCSAQKNHFRVSDKRTKVCHCAYAHENQRRENFILNTKSNGHHNAHIGFKAGVREVSHNIAECDWQKQKRFIFFCNCQVQQDKSY
ncbi:unknown [Dialister sp. CAG:357]|nr:unknown [Dialister sp. CAG:357]